MRFAACCSTNVVPCNCCLLAACARPPNRAAGYDWSACSASTYASGSSCSGGCSNPYSGAPISAMCVGGQWSVIGSCGKLPRLKYSRMQLHLTAVLQVPGHNFAGWDRAQRQVSCMLPTRCAKEHLEECTHVDTVGLLLQQRKCCQHKTDL